MGFRNSWLVGLGGVGAASAAGALAWIPPVIAATLSCVVVLLVIGSFHRRAWRIRKQDQARRKAELATIEQRDAKLRKEQRRQARALRALQEARLADARDRALPSAPPSASTEPPAPRRQRVLVWRALARYGGSLKLDLLLARELQANNAHVSIVFCDGAGGCTVRARYDDKAPSGRGLMDDWKTQCERRCFSNRGLDEVRELGIPYFTFNGAVGDETRAKFRALADELSRDEMVDHVHRGIRVGHFAASSTIKYFYGVDPMQHARFLPMLREHFYTGLLSAEAAWSVFREFQPTHVVMQHGIYVEWGPAFELAALRQIPVTRWGRAYTDQQWFVRTTDPTDLRHPHHMPEHRWRSLSRRPLTSRQRGRLQRFMDAQPLKQNNRYVLFDRTPQTPGEVRARLSLPADKPVFGVFCHLSWDAQYGYEEQTRGETFREWLEDTVATAIDTDDVHWLIKVHPAERVNQQAVGCREHVEHKFGTLPPHVQILPAEVEINPYDLLPVLDGVVTIFGTAGLEAAMLGKTVILAGHAHYGAKGFTHDSPTRADYLANLANAGRLPAPTAVQTEIARRYAYDYFISRQLPFDADVAFDERKQGQLAPRHARMLQKWADAILHGGVFAMDDDELEYYQGLREVPAATQPGLDWAGIDRTDGDVPETAARPLTGAFG